MQNMRMESFLSSYISYIPAVAICFVSALLVYKIYVLIRSKFKVLVNCWFCNHNSKVPYNLRNSWNCPKCEQYNGFTEDGDYNCEIQAQLNCSPPRIRYVKNLQNCISGNGLCDTCNENQRIIVEKLAQFEPKNESSFEKELAKYRSSLEQKHRLCVTCERHVSKILREKKKMVLGSKLAAFVLGKINTLKSHPFIKQVKSSKRMYLKNISSFCLFGLAIINFVFVVNEIIERKTKKDATSEDSLSHLIHIGMSHLIALVKVITGYFGSVWRIGIIEKLYLYVKTILVLSFYTIGFKFGTITVSFPLFGPSSLHFGSILLAFINNVLDGFKLGRSTLLLTVWSICAGIVSNSVHDFYGLDSLKVITSLAAILLSVPRFKNSNKDLWNSTTNSFHRIYSEDYFSDDSREINSVMNSTMMQNSSQNVSLNSSGGSVKSFAGKEFSPRFLSPTKSRMPFKSPIISNSYCSINNTLTDNSKNRIPNPFMDSAMHLHKTNYNRPMSALSSASFVTCSQSANLQNNFECYAQKMNNIYPINSIVENQQNRTFSSPAPSSHFSFSENQSVYRPNVVSPPRLNSKVCALQTSWVSGGYFNNQNKFGHRNYFLESSAPKDTISRASSQSSGFESQASSLSLQNGEPVFSRENSYCPDDCCPPQFEANFDKINNDKATNNSVGVFPQLRSERSFNNSFHHLTNSHIPPAVSPALSYQSLGSNYFASHSAFHSPSRSGRNSYSPFDLNQMGEDLPSIQKGSLLRKWKEQNIVLH